MIFAYEFKLKGYYLVVILSKSRVGLICDKEIWKMEKFEIIPYKNNQNGLTENEVKKHFIKKVLANSERYCFLEKIQCNLFKHAR